MPRYLKPAHALFFGSIKGANRWIGFRLLGIGFYKPWLVPFRYYASGYFIVIRFLGVRILLLRNRKEKTNA